MTEPRLIHYSKKPLTAVRSRAHNEHGAGAYKTPGLWLSVEGEDDWPHWCVGEGFGLGGFVHATEIILAPDHKVLHIDSVKGIDKFTEKYVPGNLHYPGDRSVDWEAVRRVHQGVIIAPYQWPRRLHMESSWYYGWDCASGVIWDAKAVAGLRPAELPKILQEEKTA